MNSRRHREAGETLIEILISTVVLGIIASATFYVISLGATSSKSQRDYVTADALLRDSAEATKAAVRDSCATNSTYSVKYSTLPSPDPTQNWLQYYQTARQFTLPADLTNSCPATSGPASTQVQPVSLSVTLPDNTQRKLDLVVRSP